MLLAKLEISEVLVFESQVVHHHRGDTSVLCAFTYMVDAMQPDFNKCDLSNATSNDFLYVPYIFSMYPLFYSACTMIDPHKYYNPKLVPLRDPVLC